MPSEFKYPKAGWGLVAVKRDWVPEWLYRIYCYLPSWFQPFRWIFNRELDDDS